MALNVARLSIKKESSIVRNLQVEQRKWYLKNDFHSESKRLEKGKEETAISYLIKLVLIGEL